MILTNARGFEYGVRHFYSPRSGSVVDILSEVLNVSAVEAEWLLHFGSIYLEKKRITQNQIIQEGQYLRAHTKPRRFPIERRSGIPRIVWENENYLVVDKPHGLPCHPTVDNLHENLLAELNQHHQLLLTHRLDVATGGLLVLAKSLEAQSLFNIRLKEGLIEKKYVARLTARPTSLGLWEHWMEPSPKAPKTVHDAQSPSGDLLRCLLEIEDMERGLYKIHLLTGRTHQIRAQSQAMHAPIRGDVAYGSAKIYDYERIDLKSVELQFVDPIHQEKIEISIDHNLKD